VPCFQIPLESVTRLMSLWPSFSTFLLTQCSTHKFWNVSPYSWVKSKDKCSRNVQPLVLVFEFANEVSQFGGMSSCLSHGTHTFSVVCIAYSLNECGVNTVNHLAHKAIVEVKSAPMILLKCSQLLNVDWCCLVFASHHTIYLCDLLLI
jgi:hypothetical protein